MKLKQVFDANVTTTGTTVTVGPRVQWLETEKQMVMSWDIKGF